MYRITFALDRLSHELARKDLAILLAAMMETDVIWLRAHPRIPPLATLLARGVVAYAPEPHGPRTEGIEEWSDVPSTLELLIKGQSAGANDRTLAAWHAADLQRRDVAAVPVFQHRVASDGRLEAHAVVQLPSGAVVDPSGGRGWRPVTFAARPERSRVTFVLSLFQGDHDRAISHETLRTMLDALTVIDANYLREHPETPYLYDSGVRYEEEPPGQEDWQDIPTCLRMRTGDCDDFGPWRAAEYVVRFRTPARAVFGYQKRPDGSTLYHVTTRTPNGRHEDPSRQQGMR